MERTYDPVYDEQSPKRKRYYWDTAFGLQAVDGLKPSSYMRDLVQEHVQGEKTYEEVTQEITKYHSDFGNNDNPEEKEADIVSDAIYDILNDKSFRFDYFTIKNYHKKLFSKLSQDIFHPGEFRNVNLTKKEDVLKGDTVQYQDYGLIEESLEYDFEEESSQDYTQMTREEKISRLALFTSRIWQIHPFFEGNTRTVAVFLQKYLKSLGIKTENEIFKENSLYFRNALVRANYDNVEKGVKRDTCYLELFLRNLVLDENNVLDNKSLYL